jgi:uncharacterized membrane protein
MLIKTTIALAMALALGVTSAALAARGGGEHGSRTFGASETASSGVNPADHRSLRGGKVELIMSDGKCWRDYQWGSCRK